MLSSFCLYSSQSVWSWNVLLHMSYFQNLLISLFVITVVADDSFLSLFTQICRECGLLGYYNPRLTIGICSSCKNSANLSTMKLPYTFKLLIQVMMCLNVLDIYTSNSTSCIYDTSQLRAILKIATTKDSNINKKNHYFNTIISKILFNEINSHTKEMKIWQMQLLSVA